MIFRMVPIGNFRSVKILDGVRSAYALRFCRADAIAGIQKAEQQTALVKELVEGAMEQAKALSTQKDMAAVVESQKSYLQGLQARLIDAAKASQETLVKSRDEATNIVKGAIETANKH